MERIHRAASRITSSCLSSSSIFLLLSEASLPPLRVILTFLSLSSNEWALRFPTSFPISCFARLGEFFQLLTGSCFLLLLFGSFSLLVLPLLLGTLLSFTEESTLSFSCSRTDPSLSRQGAALAHLDFLPTHDLVIWQITLFLFLFSSLILALPFCPLLRFSFHLNPSGRSGRNCFLFPPAISGYSISPDTRFSWGTTLLISWQNRERYSCLCHPF